MGLNLAESGSPLEGGSAPTRREENLGTMYSKMLKPPQPSKTRNWTSWIRRHDEDGKKCWLPLRFLAVRLPGDKGPRRLSALMLRTEGGLWLQVELLTPHRIWNRSTHPSHQDPRINRAVAHARTSPSTSRGRGGTRLVPLSPRAFLASLSYIDYPIRTTVDV
ncbi:mCG54752 [Mus musculus]|nr:mCG54752 [Mus musculus]BAB31979.1 unnamed protein product [Mus musculus]